MKRWKWIAAISASAAFLYGLTFIGGPPAPATLGIKGTIFTVEDLRSDPNRRLPFGMPQKALPEDRAILCSWDRDRYIHHFAGNSSGAFEVAFLDAQGKILEIQPLRVHSADMLEDPGIMSTVEARRSLILPEGTVKKLKLETGDQVNLSSRMVAPAEPMPTIRVDGHVLHVEISERARLRNRGLMHRPRISKDEGMLFMYPGAVPDLSFWMKNTLMSLDIAYFDDKGNLVIVRSTEKARNPVVDGVNVTAPAAGAAQFVLEVPIGWFRERGLTDEQGKPAKPVTMELPEDLRRLARQADGR